MNRLSGKVAIVTGAGRGIGRATAALFASEGAKVAVVSRTALNVERVVTEITDLGGSARGIICDIAIADDIKRAISEVADAYGQIDILVNNAVDASVMNAPIVDLTVGQLQRNFDIGPIAYLRLMQACYPYLRASDGGRVINLASMTGVLGLPTFGPYNMAKEAVRALTRTAAREWGADKITVNTVLPLANTWGAVDMPPPPNVMARYGSAEDDIAPVLLFLASKEAQFITGYSFTPDGGSIIDAAR